MRKSMALSVSPQRILSIGVAAVVHKEKGNDTPSYGI